MVSGLFFLAASSQYRPSMTGHRRLVRILDGEYCVYGSLEAKDVAVTVRGSVTVRDFIVLR